jgi:hypothetical protein
MRIKIDNTPTTTKVFKYMFGIEISLYAVTNVEKAFERLNPYFLNEKWDPINVYLDDIDSSDYSLEEQISSDQPVYIYHIKADIRNPDFSNILDIIKTSSNYVDCYQCKDTESNYAIIRYKVNVNRRIEHLLNSKYSQMYNETELGYIKNNQYIKVRYSKNDSSLFNPLMVLAKDDEALSAICEHIGITDDDLIATIKKNEYDSKFNLSNEIISSKEVC